MRIETRRLYIRPPLPADFDRFWQMVTDPVAKQYTGGVTRLSYAARKALFLEDCALPLDDRGAEFAVVEKQRDLYLGYCGFRPMEGNGGNEFFYGYCRDAWGKGYGREAACAVMGWLLDNLSHDAYLATVVPENLASVKILTGLGFRKRTSSPEPELDAYQLDRAWFTPGPQK